MNKLDNIGPLGICIHCKQPSYEFHGDNTNHESCELEFQESLNQAIDAFLEPIDKKDKPVTIQYNKDLTIYIRTGKDNPNLKADLTRLAALSGLTLNQFLVNKLKEIK